MRLGAALLTAVLAAPVGAADAVLPELDPLEIVAPRFRIPKDAPVDPQINAILLRLLRDREEARPGIEASFDSSLVNLDKLTTVTGYKLKTRYTELGFLLTEGLAGTTDFQLAGELERIARMGRNPQTRAASMVTLAYSKDARYLSVFQQALLDQNATVRFGAIESMLKLGNDAARFSVVNVARDDRSMPLRLYAAAGMWRQGDLNGKEILLRYYQDSDWFVRTMACRYLGELGGADEYRKLFVQLSQETHPVVKAELSAALLRLQKYKDR